METMTTTIGAVSCTKCNAALTSIGNMEQHRDWHKRLDDAIQGLLDWKKGGASESSTDAFARGYELGVKEKEARDQYGKLKGEQLPPFDGTLQTGRNYESHSGLRFALVGYREAPPIWEYRDLPNIAIQSTYKCTTAELRTAIKKEIL